MYNTLIILLCVLAVYGAYSLLREILVIFCKKKIVSLAVRTNEISELKDILSVTEQHAQKFSFIDDKMIVICDEAKADEFEEYGFEVYIRHKGKENHGGQ